MPVPFQSISTPCPPRRWTRVRFLDCCAYFFSFVSFFSSPVAASLPSFAVGFTISPVCSTTVLLMSTTAVPVLRTVLPIALPVATVPFPMPSPAFLEASTIFSPASFAVCCYAITAPQEKLKIKATANNMLKNLTICTSSLGFYFSRDTAGQDGKKSCC